MEKNEVDLRFGIFDFEDITHEDISTRINIKPIFIRVKGEKRNPKNQDSPHCKNNVWMMGSGLEKYSSFEDQMDVLLNIIEIKIDVLKLLCSKYYCEFSCVIITYKDNNESTPWVHLGKRYNKIAAELNIEFDVDLYAW